MIKRIAVAFLLLLLCVSIIILSDDRKYNMLIPLGMHIGDVNMGGLTREQAMDRLKRFTEAKIKQPIILTFNEKQWVFTVSEHIEVDLDKSINNIITYIQSKDILNRFIMRLRLKKTPFRADPVIKYKENKLRQTFKELNKAIMVEPMDAFFKTNGNTVSIVGDVKGHILDEDKLKENIIRVLWTENRILKIPVKEWQADRTKEDLASMEIKVKVAEYSTKFNKTLKGRTENIKIAAEKINGYVLSPEEVFSFNKTVGERTEERGYKEAPVFIDNETVPDIGGGVCQVSSTLYNLALLTDLEIIERMNHSLPVSYVPLGRDATVNYDTIDLKIKNNSSGYLLLITEVMEDSIKTMFFGRKEIDTSIELFSETVKTIPPPVILKKDFNLPKGEVRIKEGTPGYVVNLWKKHINGENESRVLISRDTYNPTPTFLYMGEKAESEESDNVIINNE
jgi:vancomycin resistance protein YoaR